MKNAKKMKKKLIYFIIVCLIAALFPNQFLHIYTKALSSENILGSAFGSSASGYKTYLKNHSSKLLSNSSILVNITEFTSSEDNATVVNDIAGRPGKSLETKESGITNWTVNVIEDGMYNIEIEYFNQKGKSATIVRKILIDGKIPYDEAGNVIFKRTFANAGKNTTDIFGNEFRSSQVEMSRWSTAPIYDSIGYYTEPLKFYLSRGPHTLSFEAIRENLTIGSITLKKFSKADDYKVVLENYRKNGYKKTNGHLLNIQGEDAEFKSDSMIYPLTDSSSPATQPSDPSKILLNTIGGQRWQTSSQFLEWSFDAPETGTYKIGIKARQNIISGQPSYRKILIDGNVPFHELNSVKFLYDTQWDIYTLGGKDPYEFYLAKGRHTIRMEVTLGEISEIIQKLNTVMSRINNTYMNFLMVTGPSPDVNRDYMFDKTLPNELIELKNVSSDLEDIYTDLLKINGIGGSQAQQIKNLAKQAKKMSEKPDRISGMFVDFVSNVSTLGNLLATLKQQPLEIDYISLASFDKNFASPRADIFANISFAIKQFVSSFYVNYSDIGLASKGGETVKVWISSGRDQANSLNQLVKNNFTNKNGIIVNIQLVPYGTLLNATLANKGPDVALSLFQNEPLNYALRGAVSDLSGFEGFDEIAKGFMPSALEALTFRNRVYGVPETQNFSMMFYRKDILNKLSLLPPNTWDDVITMLPVLQKKHLNFGLQQPYMPNLIGAGYGVFSMFLFQEGGALYNEEGSATALNTKLANNAFYRWVNFYNYYSLPAQFDFLTRFRSGEIPIGIADYSMYNVLSVFAPELEGMWDFTLVPGTKRPDGKINQFVPASITATVMMENAKNKENAWEFIKWWTNADTQEKYGNELESIMGIAARYQTANVEALNKIPWNSKDFKILMKQLTLTKGIAEVPGSYMTPRYLDFAFKQSYTATATIGENQNPGEVLQNAALLIDGEIAKKRKEFNLR
jgi:ABC-type glycerol-3-phosphate transport system substrate-binding protein